MCFLRIASFLLRTEMTGDRNQFWNNLVMTGEMPLDTAEPALAVRRDVPEHGHVNDGSQQR